MADGERLICVSSALADSGRDIGRFFSDLRDKQGLERLWLAGTPPWKRW